MVIFRAENPNVVRYIYPKLVVEDGYSQEKAIEDIYFFLDSRPEDICAAVIFDGDELVGMLIAMHFDYRDHIWIEQAWVDSSVSKADSTKMLELVEDWAIDNFGIRELRFQTDRNPQAFERRWGFEVKGHIMRKRLENQDE